MLPWFENPRPKPRSDSRPPCSFSCLFFQCPQSLLCRHSSAPAILCTYPEPSTGTLSPCRLGGQGTCVCSSVCPATQVPPPTPTPDPPLLSHSQPSCNSTRLSPNHHHIPLPFFSFQSFVSSRHSLTSHSFILFYSPIAQKKRNPLRCWVVVRPIPSLYLGRFIFIPPNTRAPTSHSLSTNPVQTRTFFFFCGPPAPSTPTPRFENWVQETRPHSTPN